MKINVTTILALAGAATVAAVDYPSNLPECGKKCATDMFGKAAELGCGPGDITCLCSNVNFGYGIRDCSAAVCASVDQVNEAIDWHNSLCSSAGVTTASLSSTTSAFGTATPSGSPVTSTATTATPITTSTWTSVFTSGSATTTLTGETTISGISGVAGATTIPQTTVTSPIVSTRTEGSSTFETTVGTTTLVSSVTGDALSSALSSQASQASSSSSSGQGSQITAAPALGFIAAAGIAAAFL
ncbi:CFEM-domain-containing protein [Parathielavia appendiculata]|uniref:CFEM-domain-containing protein n=1 Tax=Parathielavia appendiculata TaxID=2587402 RepID=A0AAN6Z028_9PEZI|nr:CFEM-domain-containing protein [Parathielavia appendiculata]